MDSKTIHKTAASGTGWLYGGQERECQQALPDFCQKKEEMAKSDNHVLITEKQIVRHWSKAEGIMNGR